MTRLIDADALSDRLHDFNAWCKDDRSQGTLFVEEWVLPTMNTIDAVPVRHGKWENTRPDAPMFGFYYCSLCGRKRTSPQDKYCPNCGARMDEE